MFSAIISFLGGNAFRLIFGEVVSYFNKKQEHELELERMKLQGDLEAAQHSRNLEAIRLQSELGVKVIEVQRDADIDRIEAGAWSGVVESTTRLTGIKFIDVWNQSVRPLLATLAILFVCFEIISAGFVLSEWSRELFAAILGIYIADRSLQKRGK